MMKRTVLFLYSILLLLPTFSFGQLQLEDCSAKLFAINDHSDSDGDGNVCEAKITLTNSANYNNSICTELPILWTVRVDLWNDGNFDFEYSSDLPMDDNELDDTNLNGIPDVYLSPTMENEEQNIELPDIEGPLSEHSVSWYIWDGCDLEFQCATSFTVRDMKAPTPFCVSLSSVAFDGSLTEIFAENFNVGVFDNCTDQSEIRFSFSDTSIEPSRVITCDDVVNSPIEIEVFFWDNYDNIDKCIVFVSVIPEGAGLDCIPDKEVFGNIKDWRGNPLEGVEVWLEAALPEYPRITYTDENGDYTFGIQPNNIDYRLSARSDDDYLGGVSTLDMVFIVRYILGIEPFTSPYQIIAADINGDYSVKASDLFVLRKLILGIITTVPGHPSWLFLDADFNLGDPSNPFPALGDLEQDPFSIEFDLISEDGYDFIGVKRGDVRE